MVEYKYIPLIVSLVYTCFYFVEVDKQVGVWLSILTHAFAIPVIYIDFPSILSISTSLTVIASLLFHILKDGFDMDNDKEFKRFDHGWSIFLIYLVVFKVAYKKIPQWGMLVLVVVTTIPIAFLTNPRTYVFLAVFAFIVMAYLLYKRFNYDYLIAYTILLLAVSSRYWPIIDNKYHRHSIWHALVFTSVFYAYYGIKNTPIKRKGTQIPETRPPKNNLKLMTIKF